MEGNKSICDLLSGLSVVGFAPFWECFFITGSSVLFLKVWFTSVWIYLHVWYFCLLCIYWFIWVRNILYIEFLIIFPQIDLSLQERIQIAKNLSKLPVRLHSVYWGSNAAANVFLQTRYYQEQNNQAHIKETFLKWAKTKHVQYWPNIVYWLTNPMWLFNTLVLFFQRSDIRGPAFPGIRVGVWWIEETVKVTLWSTRVLKFEPFCGHQLLWSIRFLKHDTIRPSSCI